MALRGQPYCYFHNRLHRLVLQKAAKKDEKDETPLELPVPEDQSAVQLSLGMVSKAMGTKRVDPKLAGLFLYGLQIASQNVSHANDSISAFTVPSVTVTKDGQELGPKQLGCDPEDCQECQVRKSCMRRRVVAGLHGGVDPLDEAAEEAAGEDADDEDDL